MAATGLQFLNGLDLWTTYGLLVSKGNGEFLLFPERKDPLEQNWTEENGIDVDLSTPRVEAKEVKLLCVLWAPDEVTWWSKRNAFFAEILKPGWQTWRVEDHKKDYSFYYKKSTNPKVFTGKITDVPDGPAYGFELELVVAEEVQINDAVSSEPVYIRRADGTIITQRMPGTTYFVPEITSIFGGDAGDDSQFTPINGILRG